MRGNVTRRGDRSWRLKFEGERDPLTGKRKTHYATVRGTKRVAEAELTRRLAELDTGTAVAPDKVTVGQYVRDWIAGNTSLAPKTRERYRQLAEGQIVPHIGAIPLQRLRPAQIAEWHTKLLQSGGVTGGPLSARTVRDANTLLRTVLQHATRLEVVSRNVAAAVRPPRDAESKEIQILSAEQIGAVLDKLTGNELRPIVILALASGMRRGEIVALTWGGVDVDAATLRVEHSMEQTSAGLRVKAPKTRHGVRTISLPASAVEVFREHHRQQLELRLLLGLGRPGAKDLVFTRADGEGWTPDALSGAWYLFVRRYELPRVTFHALRHSHASALIAAGVDIVSISKRLGHASPNVTLSVYAHKFHTSDEAAARAIEATIKLR